MYRVYGFAPDRPETDRHAEVWASRRLAEMPPCDTIIDAGCGTGRWFGKLPPHRRLVAIDGARSMLEEIAGDLPILEDPSQCFLDPPVHPSVRNGPLLVHGDLDAVLPQLAGVADILFAYLSLPENEEPERILRMFHASLKPNGRALIVTNVLLDPAGETPATAVPDLLSRSSINPFIEGRTRYSLHILLQVAGRLLPIVDKAHVVSDYHDPDRWEVRDASVVPWSGQVLVDASDKAGLEAFFPHHDPTRAFSLAGNGAVAAHLCLDLVKK